MNSLTFIITSVIGMSVVTGGVLILLLAFRLLLERGRDRCGIDGAAVAGLIASITLADVHVCPLV